MTKTNSSREEAITWLADHYGNDPGVEAALSVLGAPVLTNEQAQGLHGLDDYLCGKGYSENSLYRRTIRAILAAAAPTATVADKPAP